MHDIFRVRANPAQQTKNCLNEQRSLHQSFGPEVMQIAEVTGVVALEFITCARTVERFEGVADVLERVAEHKIMRAFQHARFPIELEFPESLAHSKQAEVQ